MSGDEGVMALEDGARVDFGRLRAERRARCLAEMERREVDVLLLGRDANARYASGVRRLWHVGSRPFGPGCVLVRESGDVHLMGIHDDGVPPEVPRDHLHPPSWNPASTAEAIGRIPGVAAAARVAVDGMTPTFAALLESRLPAAELVDGEALMRRARAAKTPDELCCLRTAVALSEAALEPVIAALEPGAVERHLLGIFAERIAACGTTVPALEGTFCATPKRATAGRAPPLRQLATDRRLEAGDLVALDAGVLYAGYEGGVGRTWPCPPDGAPTRAQRELFERWRAVMDALLEACAAGRPSAELRSAHEASGEPLPPIPIAYGLGLGFEPPVVGAGSDPASEKRAALEPDMVLSLQSYVWREGVGGVFGREVVRVTAGRPELLTRMDAGPLAA